MGEKPKGERNTKKVPVYGNPWKLNQITGWRTVFTKPVTEFLPETEKLSKELPESPQESTGELGSVTPEQLEEAKKEGFSEEPIKKKPPHEIEPRDIENKYAIPGGRGSYTADQAGADIEKKEEMKDETAEYIRQRMASLQKKNKK